MTDWRSRLPKQSEQIVAARAMQEGGFPERLYQVDLDADGVRMSQEWLAVLNWWDALETHIQGPMGIAMWERGIFAALALSAVTKRLLCWPDLPGVRPLRRGSAGFVEASDLQEQPSALAARDPDILVVGGLGTVTFGEDRSIEAAAELGLARLRAGRLTFWVITPLGTERSMRVIMRSLQAVRGSYVEIRDGQVVGEVASGEP